MPAKLSTYNADKVCNKCQDAKRAAESEPVPLPPEHGELFRAARAIFDNGIDDEDEIIPTLVFAANLSEAPQLARVWDGLATAERRSEIWAEPDKQLHEFFGGLVTSSRTVVDSVPLIRHVPFEFNIFRDVDWHIEEIAIDVYKRSAQPKEVGKIYELFLREENLDYDLSRGEVAYKTYDNFLRIMARPEERSVDPDKSILPTISGDRKFPPPQVVADVYATLRALRRADPVLVGRQRGGSFRVHNLVPACVAWYVGGRRTLIGRPDMKPWVAKLLNEHLLTPCGKDPVVDESSHPIWRNTKTVAPAILRLERAIQGESSS